jgi:methylphosphotriester-DNA--protein-cysteine methyltransferase
MDAETCYRAVSSRDPRFDGWFVTAVTTTGIYCRPSCPAMTPRRHNVRFLPTAAAAQRAGFRACRRCRPDASPGSPEWSQRSDTVARAMRLIGDGVVDRGGVTDLAGKLGYSERQLHRLLVAEVGAGAQALARAQRAHTARTLIETSPLSFSEIAFAAGFASIRQFNDTVQAVFATTPRELRRRGSTEETRQPGILHLRLPVRAPFDAGGVLEFLGRRAVPASRRSTARHTDARCGSPTTRPPSRSPPQVTTSRAHCRCETRATWCPRSPAAVGCSTSTPIPRLSTRPSAMTCCSLPWLATAPASVCRVRSTGPRSRCGQSSGSRCRSPGRARWPVGSSRSSASR